MNNKSILIVDDEHANQFLLEGLLSANGYTTLTASDGAECLSILENESIDLILLDIMMPKMSGIEVLEKICASSQLSRIPVIMVSAKTATADIKKALELGAIDYIKKPFEELELLARVNAGIRLKTKEDHLREMISQREDFVRIISHDLRSPFTAIDGFATMLLSDEKLSDDQRDSIQQIADSVGYSQEYFNKLLSWAKLERNEIELNKKQVSLLQLIDLSYRFHKKKAEKKSIHLQAEIDKLLEVEVDEIYFRQVIENLLSNAIKFTPAGGTIKCEAVKKEGQVHVVISDNGIGMPPEMTPEELFNKKVIASRRGTNNEKGTGIGLTICKKILDAHGYGLTCHGNDRGGTDFIIIIG